MILFCLPYAGGSEVMYYSWKKYLDPYIELQPIELKGRGKRFNEDFYTDFNEAVDDIFQSIKDKIICSEYAIFGHSLGSLLAYELYYKICDQNLTKPRKIFFSGNIAPSAEKEQKNFYLLPDDEFLKEIINLGGTPEELLESKELLQLVLPILRSDIRINESYIYKGREDKIECDVAIFSGRKEDVTLDELLMWKNHCNRGFKMYTLEGDHFFINNNVKEITSIIGSLLKA